MIGCEFWLLEAYSHVMIRFLVLITFVWILNASAEDWPQFMFNSAHSGNAVERDIDAEKLGLQGMVGMTDGIYTSPVVADGQVFVVDGAGCEIGTIAGPAEWASEDAFKLIKAATAK